MKQRPSVILASAGSGKTHELAGRYIGALAESPGAGAERILATTFTRKAAGEIFAKVLKRLIAAAAPQNEEADAEAGSIGGAKFSRDEARRLAVALVRHVDRVRIQTLDSFFAEVGRAFALELGLTPGWRILDEVEIEEAKQAAIDRVCEQIDAASLLTILEKMNGGALPMLPRTELFRRANELHNAFVDCGADLRKWGVIEGAGEFLLSNDQVQSVLTSLRELPEVKTKTGGPNQRFAKARAAIVEATQARGWDELLANGLIGAVMAEQPRYGTADIPKEVAGVLRRLALHAAAIEIDELAQATRAAGGLARAFDAAYSGVKREQNALTFDDLPRAMLSLPREDIEWLSFRMDSKLDRILLDEFQDTSRVQYLVIEPLLREITSQQQRGRGIFAVGDVKQSLYGWRGAEPELLAGLSERLGLGAPGTFSTSWRSSAAVLDTVNKVFEQIHENPTLAEFKGVAARWHRNFQTHSAAHDMDGSVRLFQAEAKLKGAEDRISDLVIARAIERIVAIHRERPEWRIGVLTRTNALIPRLIHLLKKHNIRAGQDRGHPLVDEPCVNALISLLQLSEHPGDTASQFHVSKTSLAGIVGLTSPLDESVGERVSRELRARIAAHGISGVVQLLRRELEGRLSERGQNRLGHAQRLADEFDALPGGTIPEFIRILEDAAVSDASSGSVSVLTVHRAKGLEWDAVVVLDLDRSWKGKPARVIVDRGERGDDDPMAPVEAVSLWPRAELQSCDSRLKAIAARHQARQVREELSGLYVAMTRAKSRLELIVANIDNLGESISSAAVLRNALVPDAADPSREELARWDHKSAAAREPAAEYRAKPQVVGPTQVAELNFSSDTGTARQGSSPSRRKAKFGVTDIMRSAAGHKGARQLGHVWHAWMEEIEWIEDWKPDESRMLEIAAGFGMALKPAREQFDRFISVVRGPIGGALSRARYSGKSQGLSVRREWGLAWKEDGVVAGRIDRLVIGLDAGSPVWAEVIDFKTDRVDEAGVNLAATGYGDQILAYRLAAARALRLNLRLVRGVLLFTHPIAIVDVESADRPEGVRTPKGESR